MHRTKYMAAYNERPLMKLDRQAVLERLDNDQELYDEICEIFMHDALNIVDQLKEAVHAGDIPVATRHAHSLKSASASIGANEISMIARQAEVCGKEGSIEEIRNLLPQIDKLLTEVLLEIRHSSDSTSTTCTK